MRTKSIVTILFLLFTNVYSSFFYEGNLHYELESIKANRYKFKDDSQNLATFYSTFGYEFLTKDDKWAFEFEMRANFKLQKQNYQTPFYRKKYPTNSEKNLFVSMALVDYYGENYAFSVGRNIIDLNWLSGSVDSITAYAINEIVQIRAFWILNYYDFNYNYYIKYQNINNNRGIGGIYLKNSKPLNDFDIEAYFYSAFDDQFLTGIKFYKTLKTFDIQGSFSLSDRNNKQESFLEFSINKNLKDIHNIEFGYSKTSDSGLDSMLKFGSYPFSKFYLSNSLDRSDAQNIYLQYSFESDKFFINSIAGITSYMGKYVKSLNDISNQKLSSYEIDLTLGYKISNNLSLTLGYMILDLDEKDSLEFDQDLALITLSMEL